MNWFASTVSSGVVWFAVCAAAPLQAQCPEWKAGFHVNGIDREVLAIETVGQGPGARLYAGGRFRQASGISANNIAVWDGAGWSALGSGIDGWAFGGVFALASHDDGSGDALYAAGFFTLAGGAAASSIARWDGSAWSTLADGLSGSVHHLIVFDDGSGPALYAGGQFTHASGVPVNGVAKWDGSAWSALGSGLAGKDYAVADTLAVFDDGSGPALIVGGTFETAGGVLANNIARWDGSTWTALGSGTTSSVRALAVFDEGGEPALYAAGLFNAAGGVTVPKIARWNGASWSAFGTYPVNGLFSDLLVHDDGTGPALHVSGNFSAGGLGASSIAKWNGSDWAPLAGGTNGLVTEMTVFDDGSGARLVAGGEFGFAGGTPANSVASWNGSAWSGLGDGSGVDNTVFAMVPFDDGSGPALHVGGAFGAAGSAAPSRIARWNGSSWTPLAGGMTSSSPAGATVRALAVFDDGDGAALFAGGSFATAGGIEAQNIARWDGSTWSPLASGIGGGSEGFARVSALAVHDDGSGPALYAGGRFTTAGGAPANYIARWDGAGWSPVGSGIGSSIPSWLWVEALAVYDDGSGPALYAGGAFTSAGGAPASCIAKWDGVAWSEVGGGTNHIVLTLAVFDAGSGPELYAGGHFTMAGGIPVQHVARWNGSSWSAAGAGLSGSFNAVRALAVQDDGSGPGLFAGGSFAVSGAVPVNAIARWDGSDWSALDAGLSYVSQNDTQVFALAAFDDGTSRGLYAGGIFERAGDVYASFLAEWTACEDAPLGVEFCFGDGTGAACPCGNFGLPGHGCMNSSTVRGAELTAAGFSSTVLDSVVLTSAFENPGAASIFLQGTQSIAPVPFGDGLRCTGGSLKRLYLASASAEGVVSAPTGSASPISQRSAELGDAILAGETRVYQVYYRDPSPTFCPAPAGSTFNVSQAMRILWTP